MPERFPYSATSMLPKVRQKSNIRVYLVIPPSHLQQKREAVLNSVRIPDTESISIIKQRKILSDF